MCGLQLLVYKALSYECVRPSATKVYEAFSYYCICMHTRVSNRTELYTGSVGDLKLLVHVTLRY